MSTPFEMLIAAGRAVGHDQDPSFLTLVECGYWNPRVDSGQSFHLATALRISVEHNHAEETRPWVCATIDGGPLRMKKAFVEDVPDESQRADRMRLAILRCAAAQAPAVAMETVENGSKTDGNGLNAGSRRGGGA